MREASPLTAMLSSATNGPRRAQSTDLLVTDERRAVAPLHLQLARRAHRGPFVRADDARRNPAMRTTRTPGNRATDDSSTAITVAPTAGGRTTRAVQHAGQT